MRRPLAVIAALAAVALVAYLRVRSESVRWWARVERLCACGRPTERRLAIMSSLAAGGLDRALAAQGRSLAAGCDDLRAAMARRSAWDALRGADLRVTPTAAHVRAQRDVARELGLTCGEEHRVFWRDVRARVERDSAPGQDAPHDTVRAISEFVRVHDAMCGRRAVLSAPPDGYTLTAADADRQGRTCGQ